MNGHQRKPIIDMGNVPTVLTHEVVRVHREHGLTNVTFAELVPNAGDEGMMRQVVLRLVIPDELVVSVCRAIMAGDRFESGLPDGVRLAS